MTTREQLATLTARLYDAETPEGERRDLSLEVSILRCRLARCRDPLSAMIAGSGESDDDDAAEAA